MPPRPKGKTVSIRGVENLDGSGTYFAKMAGNIRDWQIKCVCGGVATSCNSGWMKKIEDQARPILIPLILGQNLFLTPIQREIVAVWVALKCMVGEYEDPTKITTPPEQRARMYAVQKPPEHGWGIWIGRAENPSRFTIWSSHSLKIALDKTLPLDDPSHKFNGHTTTQMIGELFIQVIRFPPIMSAHKWNFRVPVDAKLTLIWPPVNSILKWPKPPLSYREQLALANNLRDFAIETARRRG